LNRYGLTFHHLGLALREEKQATAFLTDLGYTPGPRVEDPLQGVALRLCPHREMPAVEIITPLSEENDGPLANYLKAGTAVIYHVCYECDALEATVAAWKNDGHRVVALSEPKPAVLFDGRRVAFYSVRGFGMVELLER